MAGSTAIFPISRISSVSARLERSRTSTGPLRILYSGALIKRKGVDLLASAFRRLAQTHDSVSLSVVGSGPLRPLMERLLGPAAARTVFHDFVPWRRLAQALRRGGCALCPLSLRRMGIDRAGGMAAGMPVIATDSDGRCTGTDRARKEWLAGAGRQRGCIFTRRSATAADLSPNRRAAMGLVGPVPRAAAGCRRRAFGAFRGTGGHAPRLASFMQWRADRRGESITPAQS